MKTKRVLTAAVILATVTLLNSSFANQKINILHYTPGSQGYIVISVSPNALQGHAKHGDLYLNSFCPVDGPEFGCR